MVEAAEAVAEAAEAVADTASKVAIAVLSGHTTSYIDRIALMLSSAVRFFHGKDSGIFLHRNAML